jgi:hypothetical protein
MNTRLAGFLLASALAACAPRASFVKADNVALGRIVVYRNGVAFYERRATVTGGVLEVSVPRDRVDDFLKSLTVVDARTNQPLPVSIPRQQTDAGAYLEMKLQLPSKDVADVVLTYVTEAPAWKPSYRVVVGDRGKVMLEGWAIVDNTSGEDWKGVRVGVGASSALSFKYDLWSVRQIQRQTLAAEERFAVAPPTGVSPYGGNAAPTDVASQQGQVHDGQVLADLGGNDILGGEGAGGPAGVAAPMAAPPPTEAREEVARVESTTADSGDDDDVASAGKRAPRHKRAADRDDDDRPAPAKPSPQALQGRLITSRIAQLPDAVVHGGQLIVIESVARDAAQATARAAEVESQLIDQGVAASRIRVDTKLDPTGSARLRLVAQAAPAGAASAATADADADAQPVGESNFTNPTPMTVERGASAMVSMVRGETDGEVVYLYDAESERGNDKFAFRAVRFRNPTDSTLETGPVTVYGNERFIGEGLTEPIPPKASAVVPYALDRQIVVERNDGEEDRLSRLETLQRGVLTAEVQHVRRSQLTITNRLPTIAKVFLRHTVAKGWTLLDAPPQFERIGDAHLFEVDLAPNEVKHVEIAEATPVQRSLDIGADPTMQMMKVYLDAPEGTPELKDQFRKLLGIHKQLVDLDMEQDSLRHRLADYKQRMDELHAQIVTLQAVKTGNDLMANLKQKMRDISDRVQKTTIAIVDSEEQLMLARVRYQDALAELTLPDAIATQPPVVTVVHGGTK